MNILNDHKMTTFSSATNTMSQKGGNYHLNSLYVKWRKCFSLSVARLKGCRGGGGGVYLLVVLVQAFDLGVVHRQVPAVCRAHLVAVAVEQGLPLGRHGLQRGQHCASTALPHPSRPAQIQGSVLISISVIRTLPRKREERGELIRE